MTNDAQDLPTTRVDVSDLLDAPGATRPVELDVPTPEGFEVPLTTFGDEVSVDGVLESLVDGVLLRVTLGVQVAQQCGACLEPATDERMTADVAERTGLYEQAQVIFKREAPWATIAHSIVFMPMSDRVRNYRMDPLGAHRFDGVDLAD